MPDLTIGQFVTFREGRGPVWSGSVVSFDDRMVALCSVQLLADQGNPVFRTPPIMFVDRAAVHPVK